MKQSTKNTILKQSKAGYLKLLAALQTRSPLASDDKKIVNLRRQVAATGEDALAFERALLEGEGYDPCFFEGAEAYAEKAIAEEKAAAAAAAK